ncbi:MAG: phage tail protein [Patiriisocius sp.]|uniref:phage tail protein n=1 Tax=Patiriisocius sp. TaxID=2822396 RepID=UPI003EF226DC
MEDGYLGQVLLFAGNFAPRGWAFCQGQIQQIAKNQSLFAILGTKYGGDGRTTFGLPKMESQDEVTYIICVEGMFPSRN